MDYVAEIAPTSPDSDVLRMAEERSAILITSDKDFGELVFRQRLVTHGVVLVRLPGIPPSEKARMVRAAIQNHSEQLVGSFAVVAPGSIRIRSSSEL